MTNPTAEENRQRYEKVKAYLLEKCPEEEKYRKDGLEKLLSYLETTTTFLDAPASTVYHCSYKSGLVEHSVNVANMALKLNRTLKTKFSDWQVTLVALLHDCGKHCQYYQKEPTPKQKQYGYPGNFGYNLDIPYMNHEDRSLYIISQFITLTEEEYAAIAFHNYLFRSDDPSFFNASQLAWILAMADGYCTAFIDTPGRFN